MQGIAFENVKKIEQERRRTRTPNHDYKAALYRLSYSTLIPISSTSVFSLWTSQVSYILCPQVAEVISNLFELWCAERGFGECRFFTHTASLLAYTEFHIRWRAVYFQVESIRGWSGIPLQSNDISGINSYETWQRNLFIPAEPHYPVSNAVSKYWFNNNFCFLIREVVEFFEKPRWWWLFDSVFHCGLFRTCN